MSKHSFNLPIQLQNSASDPTTGLSNGIMYYNTTSHKSRIYANGIWKDAEGTASTSGGGGITNNAALNELMKSDGTNAVSSGIFSTSNGNMTLGTGLIGDTRSFIAAGTEDDIGFEFNIKGSSSFNITGNGSLNIVGRDGFGSIIRLAEDINLGTNTISLVAPTSITSNISITLPSSLPTVNNQPLISSTTGTTSWGESYFDGNQLFLGLTTTTGTGRNIIAQGSATNLQLSLQSKGNGDMFLLANGTGGRFLFRDTNNNSGILMEPVNQTFGFFGTSTSAQTIHSINGITSSIHGRDLILRGGNAHSTATGNGGSVYVVPGNKFTGGTDGNIGLLTSNVSNWQNMQKGIYVAGSFVNPLGNPSNGAFFYADTYDSYKPKWRVPDGTTYTLSDLGSGGSSTSGITTASNGLTVVGSDVRLGGTLLAGATTIEGSGFGFQIGSFANRISIFTVNSNNGMSLIRADTNNNSIQTVGQFYHALSSGSAANGIGSELTLIADRSPGNTTMRIQQIVTNVASDNQTFRILGKSNGSEVSFLEIKGGVTESLQLQAFGPVKLKDYTTGTLPTASNHAYALAYDTTTNNVKYSDGSTWSTVGTITSSTNGLTVTGNTVKIGGTLTESTTIIGDGNSFDIGTIASPLDGFSVSAPTSQFQGNRVTHLAEDISIPSDASAVLSVISRGQTTNNTITEIFSSNSSTVIGVPTDSAMTFEMLAIASQDDISNCKSWRITGGIKNAGGTTSLIGAGITTTVIAEDAGATGWSITVDAENTSDYLRIRVTGANSTTINWVVTTRIVFTLF